MRNFIGLIVALFCIIVLSGCSRFPEQFSEINESSSLFEQYESQGYELRQQVIIGNKTAFAGFKNKSWIIVFDGDKFGPFVDDFSYGRKPPSLSDVFGKLAFSVYNETEWLVFLDGKLVTTFTGGLPYNCGSSQPEGISFLGTIGDKFVVSGYRNGASVLLVDGEEQEGGEMYYVKDVDGKIAYVEKKGGTNFVILDGKEIFSTKGMIFLSVIGGKLAFIFKDGEKWYYGDQDGTMHKGYDSISTQRDVSGKPAYIARENGKSFVVFDGIEGERYSDVEWFRPMTIVDDKPVYVAKNYFEGDQLRHEKFLVVFDGPKSQPYGSVHYEMDIIDGIPTAQALKNCDNKSFSHNSGWTRGNSEDCVPCTVQYDGLKWIEKC